MTAQACQPRSSLSHTTRAMSRNVKSNMHTRARHSGRRTRPCQTTSFLPNELMKNVVEQVASSEYSSAIRDGILFNLMLTSCAFHDAAKCVLYRHVAFFDGSSNSRKICSALKGGAAKHVHSLRVTIPEGKRQPQHFSKTVFFELPITRMGRLSSLSIHAIGQDLFWDPGHFFEFLSRSIKDDTLCKLHVPISLAQSDKFVKKQARLQDVYFHCQWIPSVPDTLSPEILAIVTRIGQMQFPGDEFPDWVQNCPIRFLRTTRWNISERFDQCFPIATRLIALDLGSEGIPVIYASSDIAQPIISEAVNLRFLKCCPFEYVNLTTPGESHPWLYLLTLDS